MYLKLNTYFLIRIYLFYFVDGAYDVTTHDCCEGHLLKRNGPFWRCCGNKTIDYDIESCCAGMNFTKRINKCCGGKFNEETIFTKDLLEKKDKNLECCLF